MNPDGTGDGTIYQYTLDEQEIQMENWFSNETTTTLWWTTPTVSTTPAGISNVTTTSTTTTEKPSDWKYFGEMKAHGYERKFNRKPIVVAYNYDYIATNF